MSLYHYTNLKGLRGIIENKKLFLTHFAFMNDQQELIHGIHIIMNRWKDSFLDDHERMWSDAEDISFKPELPKRIHQKFISDRKKESENIFIKKFNSFVEDFTKQSNIFSCSFSQDGDLLSQWRGYGGNETGYCIEFDEEALLSNLHNQFENEDTYAFGLTDCVYDESRKTEIAEELCKQFDSFDETSGDEYLIIMETAMKAIKFKDKSFSEENEKRIIVSYFNEFSNTKFRDRNGVFVPYVEYEFPLAAIKSIRVGPSSQQNMAVEGLNKYIYSIFGNESPKVLVSDTPFRMT